MVAKSSWQDLQEKLENPATLGALVCVGVVIFLQFRLVLFAAALPALALYWHYTRQSEEEEEDDQDQDAAEADDVPNQSGILEFDDRDFIRRDADAPLDGVDPYSVAFWGSGDALPASPAKAKAQPHGTPQRAAKRNSSLDSGIEHDLGIGNPSSADLDVGFEPLCSFDDHDPFGHIPGGGRGKGRGKGKSKDKSKGDGSGGGMHDAAPRGPDPKQVFVAGISDVPEDDLRTFFEKVGEVDRLKVLCEPDGQPKGVCFVTFHSEVQAQEAIRLHGSELQGRRITIRPAHGGKGGGKGGGGKADGKADGAPPRRDPPGPLAGTELSGTEGMDDTRRAARSDGPEPRAAEPRTEIDDLLEEALSEENGPLQLKDFDSGAKKFLTELMQRDRTHGTKRSVEALEMVFRQTRSKDRESVRKWPAYIFTLLQKFDPDLSDEIATKRLLERDAERRRGAGPGSRNDAPHSNDIARAWEFVPDPSEASGTRQVLDRWGKPVLI